MTSPNLQPSYDGYDYETVSYTNTFDWAFTSYKSKEIHIQYTSSLSTRIDHFKNFILHFVHFLQCKYEKLDIYIEKFNEIE